MDFFEKVADAAKAAVSVTKRHAKSPRGEERSSPPAEGQKRQPIPREVKKQVWARDRGRCRYCRITDAKVMARDGEHLQYDHIVPWSQNGADTVNNVQLLCGPCNRVKGVKVPA